MNKGILNFVLITTLAVVTILVYYLYHYSYINYLHNLEQNLPSLNPIFRDRLFASQVHSMKGSKTRGLRNNSFKNEPSVIHLVKGLSQDTVYYPGDYLPTYTEYRVSDDQLPRRLDLKLEKQLFNLMLKFTNMLTSHGISFTMTHGMLLGSYLFHTIIPWNDDLDLFIDIKDVNNLKAMFRTEKFSKTYGVHSFWENDMYSDSKLKEQVPWDNTYSCGSGSKKDQKCYQQGKVYFKYGTKAGEYPWTFPFVDFIFYKNNGTHVFNHANWKQEPKVILPVEEFYPLTLRPFDRYWLPAPKNTLQVLKCKFKQFQCKGGDWDHVNEKEHKSRGKQKVACDKLRDNYPVVRRRKYPTENGTEIKNKVIEDLMLADVVLHSVVIDVAFTKANILKLE